MCKTLLNQMVLPALMAVPLKLEAIQLLTVQGCGVFVGVAMLLASAPTGAFATGGAPLAALTAGGRKFAAAAILTCGCGKVLSVSDTTVTSVTKRRAMVDARIKMFLAGMKGT